MFKSIIQFLNSNTLLASISKVILVTTVSLTSVTSSAYIIDSITKPEESKKEDSFLSENEEINQIDKEEDNKEEIQTSSSIKTEVSSGLNWFISDIVTGPSKLVENTIGYVSGGNTVDTTTISTSPISNEDTSTGSSRKIQLTLLVLFTMMTTMTKLNTKIINMKTKKMMTKKPLEWVVYSTNKLFLSTKLSVYNL